jgi:hypothetical protein
MSDQRSQLLAPTPSYSHSILDCVNNVACVGHSHPRVARAAAQQLLRVNTNTRYLCPVRVSYARKLLAKFGVEGKEGGRLSTVFFVNSGSEANVSHQFSDPSRTEDSEPDPHLAASQDLALRMARAFTKSQEVIVLDSAYHGHTAALIDVSPYKYEGKGGFPRPQHTHQATAPDVYRCSNKAADSNCSALGLTGAPRVWTRGAGAATALTTRSRGPSTRRTWGPSARGCSRRARGPRRSSARASWAAGGRWCFLRGTWRPHMPT